MRYDPHKVEEEILEFWEKNKIPEEIVKFDPKKKKFYLLDGPPYVNGVPHVGHVKTTTTKDIISKLKTMQGYAVWYQPGFDTHGLPIENVVEKKLGIKSKKDIERHVGVERFMEECKKLAEGNEKVWLRIYKRLGAWRGWLKPYMTFKRYYLESAWWTIKRVYENGMLVLGEKPVFWCPHCETTLAGYEVTDSYAEVEDYSIYVKFPIEGRKNEYILIWTTTPWTLPANVAIAVHPEESYVKVRVGKDILIMAEKRLESVVNETKIEEYEVIEKMKGRELAGMRYKPVLDIPIQKDLEKEKNAHKVILSLPLFKKGVSSKILAKKKVKMQEARAEHLVTMDTGSGCVHIAPGHGEEDYKLGEHYNLPKPSPVNEEGRLKRETGSFSGIFVKDANIKIIEYLKKKGFLLWYGKIRHSYPLCWRCKTPLIYRMNKQWFFTVEKIKDKMLEENENVRWMPEFAKDRFKNWLTNAIDWAISVQRYWGIPLPVWVCKQCNSIEVIGSVKELKEKAINELPSDIDLHKNVVDKIRLKCRKCGSCMERVKDTMNVWFDSGIAPWASLGYPFRNKELFEKLWPVDFISESQDQIRGWFYSLMFMGVATFNEKPYKAVGMTGWTLDERGEKMSKSLGNVIYAEDAINNLGSDLLRFYYCWSNAPWDTQNFSLRVAKELRRVLDVLWNASMFIINYSNLGIVNEKINLSEMKIEDKWVISRVNTLIKSASDNFENFRLHYAGREIGDFILNDFSRWYIKIIRDRMSHWYKGEDKKYAMFTLFYVMEKILRLLAPITPFITEKIYQMIFKMKENAPRSVHLSSWPKYDKGLINKRLEEDMEIVKGIVEGINSLRQIKGVKLRWPVSCLYVKAKDVRLKAVIKNFEDIIKSLGNVKDISILDKLPSDVKKELEYCDICIGSVVKDEAMVRELTRKIQVLRKEAGLKVWERIRLYLHSTPDGIEIIKRYEERIKNNVGADEVIIKKQKKIKGRLEFENKSIDIYFEKV